MGKLKRSTFIKANLNSKKKNSKQLKLTVEELIDMANECMDQFELENAFNYVKQALEIDGKHKEALETMASIQMEMGNTDNAKSIYEKLVELDPNNGFSKYMCLAQLSNGIQAVNLYKKGIELMMIEYEKEQQEATKSKLKAASASSNGKPSTSKSAAAAEAAFDDDEDDEEEQRVTKSDISTAYGSIAELYLTDLCMEEDAADNCKIHLDKSLDYDAKNPESLQLLASYWLSKDEPEKARTAILQSLDCWLPLYCEAEESGPMVDPSQSISLTYDARINTSRILTEVKEYDKAVQVLEQLVEEDDEVVVVWYMLGWVNHCKGEDYYSNAKFYLKKANELSLKIKYEQKYLDQSLRDHIKELLEQLSNVKSDDEEEEENGGDKDDEEEYETTDDDEDDDDEQQQDENNNDMKMEH